MSRLAVLAELHSPGSGEIHLGPLQLRAHGVMIALGVLAAVWLTGRRFEQRGIGTRDDAAALALWAVPASCTLVRTERTRVGLDGRVAVDEVRALYRREAGLDCDHTEATTTTAQPLPEITAPPPSPLQQAATRPTTPRRVGAHDHGAAGYQGRRIDTQ